MLSPISVTLKMRKKKEAWLIHRPRTPERARSRARDLTGRHGMSWLGLQAASWQIASLCNSLFLPLSPIILVIAFAYQISATRSSSNALQETHQQNSASFLPASMSHSVPGRGRPPVPELWDSMEPAPKQLQLYSTKWRPCGSRKHSARQHLDNTPSSRWCLVCCKGSAH